MSRQTSITCDQCGVQKKESNHWWSIEIMNGEFRSLQIRAFILSVKTVLTEHPERHLDICSEECAHRLLGKWMRGELGK